MVVSNSAFPPPPPPFEEPFPPAPEEVFPSPPPPMLEEEPGSLNALPVSQEKARGKMSSIDLEIDSLSSMLDDMEKNDPFKTRLSSGPAAPANVGSASRSSLETVAPAKDAPAATAQASSPSGNYVAKQPEETVPVPAPWVALKQRKDSPSVQLSVSPPAPPPAPPAPKFTASLPATGPRFVPKPAPGAPPALPKQATSFPAQSHFPALSGTGSAPKSQPPNFTYAQQREKPQVQEKPYPAGQPSAPRETRNPISLPNTGSDLPRNNSALTMKEVEELEMLTQKLMKDMEHPPHAEASTSELCGLCSKALSRTQPAVRALDKLFHVECFTCFKCVRQLQGQQFYNVDEKPFCEECYAVSKMVGKVKVANHGDLGEGRKSMRPVALAVHGLFSSTHFRELYHQLMRATCVIRWCPFLLVCHALASCLCS